MLMMFYLITVFLGTVYPIFTEVISDIKVKGNNRVSSETIINFLSNKSHLGEDLSIILKMPKIVFLKAIFQQK